MSVKDELTVIERSLEDLDRAIGRLEQHLGKGLEMRRLRLDAGHLREDLALLRAGTPAAAEARPVQLVTIPDTPYDASLWRDADEEGLGCRDRRAP
ncbi:hypothetical protein [Streptomyces sp. NPDC049555]|uniref:hypothetical protein n=1 Tax=unclassified Streptomyces TaxID=2593676 RepID=UPI00341601CF